MSVKSFPAAHIITPLALLLLISLILPGCATSIKTNENSGAAPAMPVMMMTVMKQSYLDNTEFMAQVNSKHATDIHPQVSSRITKLLVTDGQLVHAGQPLYQLDISQQAATVNSLNASRRASLQGPDILQKCIEAQQADLTAAQANLAFSRKQLDRYRQLYSNHTVSARDTEQYETTVLSQEQKVKALAAEIASQQKRRQEALANISRDTATWQSARANLAYYTVRAPFTGNVGALLAKVGDVVDPGATLTTLTDNRNLEIEVAVSADYRSRLHSGTEMMLLSTMDKPLGNVNITYIAPQIDPMTQTFLVKAKTTNDANLLTMDQRLKARLIWGKQEAILLPVMAVFRVDGQPFVYRVEHEKTAQKEHQQGKEYQKGLIAKMQAVQLGPIVDQNVVIQSGVHPGQTIVTAGIQKLQDGTPVTLARAEPAASK